MSAIRTDAARRIFPNLGFDRAVAGTEAFSQHATPSLKWVCNQKASLHHPCRQDQARTGKFPAIGVALTGLGTGNVLVVM